MKLPLLLFFCLLHLLIYSQPVQIKTYAETYREQQHQREFDSYMDGIRNQRNSNIINTDIDKKAIEKIAEQWSRKPVKVSPEEEAAKEEARRKAREEARKRREEEELRNSEFDYNIEMQHRAWAKKIYQELIEIGFTEDDADYLSDYYTPYSTKNGGVAYKISAASIEEIKQAAGAILAFNKKMPTAKFDELLQLTYPVRRMVSTFFKMTDQLEKRWPAELEVLNKARFISTCFVYDEWPKGNLEFKSRGFGTEVNSSEVKKTYLPFFRTYMRANLALMINTLAQTNGEFAPVHVVAWDDKNSSNNVNRELYKTCLYIPFPLTADTTIIDYNYQHPCFKETFRGLLGFGGANNGTLTVELLRDVAKFQKVSEQMVIERWLGKQRDALSTLYSWTEPYYRRRPSLYPLENIIELLQQAADAGIPSCQNAYAVQLIGSKNAADISKGLDYLEKAVSNGSVWARLNIAFEAANKTPGAPEFESQKKALKAFADTASQEKRAELANCFLREELVLYRDPWFYTFAYDLMKKLSEEGHTYFRQYLANTNNVFRYGFETGNVKDMDWGPSYSRGKYTGPIVNGRPHGNGKLATDTMTETGNFVLGVKKGKFTRKEKGEKTKTIEY